MKIWSAIASLLLILAFSSCGTFSEARFGIGYQLWSPASAQISFDISDDKLPSSTLYVMDIDGSNRRQLSNTDSMNFSPAWSPLGDQIAFISYSNKHNGQLYLQDANGENIRQITNGTLNLALPLWSPDGKQIALLSCNVDAFCKLNVVDVIDGTLHELTDYMNLTYQTDLSWSPNGKQIAYSAYANGLPSKLFIIDIATKKVNQATNGVGNDQHPIWLSDTQLVFKSNRAIPSNQKYYFLYLLNTTDNNVRQLNTVPGVISLAVLPDHQGIVFNLDSDINVDHQTNSPIYIMNVDGTHIKQLSHDSNSSELIPSPDGGKLAIGYGNTIRIIDIDSGNILLDYRNNK